MTVVRPNLNATSGWIPKEDGWTEEMNAFIDNVDAASPVSVKAHGAMGDNLADDTAAFYAAEAALPTGGGVIYVPSGRYIISSTLSFTKRVQLRGVGWKGDHTFPDNPSVIIKKSTGLTYTAIVFNIEASGIFDMVVQGASGNLGNGVQMRCPRAHMQRVIVAAMGAHGVIIGEHGSVLNSNVASLNAVNSRFNGGDGFQIGSQTGAGGPDSNAGSYVSCSASNNTGKGFRIKEGSLNAFLGIHAEANGQEGVYIEGNSDVNSFFGGDIEGNLGTHQVNIAGTSTNQNTFIGVQISGTWTEFDQACRTRFIGANTFQTGRERLSTLQGSGEFFGNGPGGGAPTGIGTFMSIYSNNSISDPEVPANESLRIGIRSTAPSGISPNSAHGANENFAQILVVDNLDLHLVPRINAGTGDVKLWSGQDGAGYAVLTRGGGGGASGVPSLETTENLVLIPSSNTRGFIEIGELTSAAANGAANTCRLYVRDNGAGKTQLYARFGSGAEVTVAGVVEP